MLTQRLWTAAVEFGKKLVEEYMKDCGLSGNQVEISIEKKTISPDGWNHPPMETSLLVMGVGMRERSAWLK